MERTGVISLENLKRQYPRWQRPLIALTKKRLVEEYGVACYALTQKATGFMPDIMPYGALARPARAGASPA
jgi:hypothetical protein